MTTLNEGRNEIRFNNSSGKCLLENWVEERAVSNIDPPNLNCEHSSSAQTFKEGHRGLLTENENSEMEKTTTVRDSYKSPQGPNVRLKESGALGLPSTETLREWKPRTKQEALERMLYEKVSQEVHQEFNQPPEIAKYKSVTHMDFNREEFVSKKPAPTQHHDLIREQPVTFWTEHKERLHGVSQHKVEDTPFRKNTAFSKPISEYCDEPQPYEQEKYPNM